jgi:hypothetical protein
VTKRAIWRHDLAPVWIGEVAIGLDRSFTRCLEGRAVLGLDALELAAFPLTVGAIGQSGAVEGVGADFARRLLSRLGRIYRLREGLILLGFQDLSRHGWYPRAFSGSGWRFCTYDAHKYGHLTGLAFSPHRRSSADGRTARGRSYQGRRLPLDWISALEVSYDTWDYGNNAGIQY